MKKSPSNTKQSKGPVLDANDLPLPSFQKKEPGIITSFINIVDVLNAIEEQNGQKPAVKPAS